MLTADIVDGVIDALMHQAVDSQWLTRDETLAFEGVALGEFGVQGFYHYILVAATVLNSHHTLWMPPQREACSRLQGVAVDVVRVKDL